MMYVFLSSCSYILLILCVAGAVYQEISRPLGSWFGSAPGWEWSVA